MRTTFPCRVSRGQVGSLDFHIHPRIMRYPYPALPGWMQRKQSGHLGLSQLPSRNEATPILSPTPFHRWGAVSRHSCLSQTGCYQWKTYWQAEIPIPTHPSIHKYSPSAAIQAMKGTWTPILYLTITGQQPYPSSTRALSENIMKKKIFK